MTPDAPPIRHVFIRFERSRDWHGTPMFIVGGREFMQLRDLLKTVAKHGKDKHGPFRVLDDHGGIMVMCGANDLVPMLMERMDDEGWPVPRNLVRCKVRDQGPQIVLGKG